MRRDDLLRVDGEEIERVALCWSEDWTITLSFDSHVGAIYVFCAILLALRGVLLIHDLGVLAQECAIIIRNLSGPAIEE